MKNTIVCFSKSPISYFRLIRSYFVFSEVGEQVERFCTSHLPKLGASWERACYTLYSIVILLQQKNQWGGGLGGGRRSCLVEVDKPGVLVVMEDMLDQVMFISHVVQTCAFSTIIPLQHQVLFISLSPVHFLFSLFSVLFFPSVERWIVLLSIHF